jgi:L-ascorbate metabolism protein UlaG (beta-lactamase superfamily)
MQSRKPPVADRTNGCREWLIKACLLPLGVVAGLSGDVSADVMLTQLANEGVLVSDGETRILIDAMVVEPYSVYGGLPEDVLPAFDNLTGPFADIDLVLVSHRHHEHNQPAYACQFMTRSRQSLLKSSDQVIGLMRERCRELVTTSPRVEIIDPLHGSPTVFEVKGARVTVFPLSHGTQSYARIQNFGHLIEIGGVTVLHVGDAAMSPEDFALAGLDQIRIDVALIPFWFFQPGPGGAIVDRFLGQARKVAVHIPPGEMEEVKAYMDTNFPEVLILAKVLDMASFSPPRPPSP